MHQDCQQYILDMPQIKINQ